MVQVGRREVYQRRPYQSYLRAYYYVRHSDLSLVIKFSALSANSRLAGIRKEQTCVNVHDVPNMFLVTKDGALVSTIRLLFSF